MSFVMGARQQMSHCNEFYNGCTSADIFMVVECSFDPPPDEGRFALSVSSRVNNHSSSVPKQHADAIRHRRHPHVENVVLIRVDHPRGYHSDVHQRCCEDGSAICRPD